jgi:hypothetical protein
MHMHVRCLIRTCLRLSRAGSAQRVTFEHDGKTAPPPSRAVQIADADGNDANPPAEPDRVAPRDITAAVARGWAAAGALLELPGQSFTTLTWEL